MAKTIAQRELRNVNAKVIDAVIAGESFVVTRNGEPVAELRPLRAGRRTLISRAEVAALAATNVRIDQERFRTDLDAVIDQSGEIPPGCSIRRASFDWHDLHGVRELPDEGDLVDHCGPTSIPVTPMTFGEQIMWSMSWRSAQIQLT
ncbi:MAG TPA: hypothetical protein VES60_01405 [Nakamurella sp.]|nr:hypothetical protein [Nakamurella sp.]